MEKDNNSVNMNAPLPEDAVNEIEQAFNSLDGQPQGETVVETPQQATQEETQTDQQETTPETKVESGETASQEQSITPPNRYEGETDTQYQLRTEIWRAGRAKASAETEEEKSLITQHIKELRKGLAQESSKTNTQTPPQNNDTPAQQDGESEEELARKALQELGYLDKKGVQEYVEQVLNQQKVESSVKEHSQAINEFFKSRPDIAGSPDKVKMLENYVIQNFNISPNTSKKQLLTHLDMAGSYLFPKMSRTANVAEATAKRTIVNQSGGSASAGQSDENTRNLMKEAGFSDEDIRLAGW